MGSLQGEQSGRREALGGGGDHDHSALESGAHRVPWWRTPRRHGLSRMCAEGHGGTRTDIQKSENQITERDIPRNGKSCSHFGKTAWNVSNGYTQSRIERGNRQTLARSCRTVVGKR